MGFWTKGQIIMNSNNAKLSARAKAKRSKRIFKLSYIGFAAAMVIVIIICSFSVRSILKEYEANQPEYQAEAAMKELVSNASKPNEFWSLYSLDDVTASVYEKDNDIKGDFLKTFTDNELNYVIKNGTYPEDELHYVIRKDKTELAEVVLKADGEPITKLAVFTSRKWKIAEIKPIFEPHDYTLQVPDDFVVSANGISLNSEENKPDENGLVKYTIAGVYNEPKFDISDSNGNKVSYVVKAYKVMPEYYDYTLTLPYTLKVSVNGVENEGVERDGGFRFHEIRMLEKPEVIISDLYGNSIEYSGKAFDLTYMTITAPDSFDVSVGGNSVPDSAATLSVNPEFELIKDLVTDLPKQAYYNIAVLSGEAQVLVKDSNGNEVTLDAEAKDHNLMQAEVLANVPESIASEIDVLDVAQKWSLYMSNDFSFANISKLMLPNSYQYKAAKEYSTSIDRTFFSNHTLLDPAFTENKVTDFVQITDDCFSVEVSFVKHMLLTRTGDKKDDPMNDRFYFVKKDGKWLLAAMKEVVSDGE